MSHEFHEFPKRIYHDRFCADGVTVHTKDVEEQVLASWKNRESREASETQTETEPETLVTSEELAMTFENPAATEAEPAAGPASAEKKRSRKPRQTKPEASESE